MRYKDIKILYFLIKFPPKILITLNINRLLINNKRDFEMCYILEFLKYLFGSGPFDSNTSSSQKTTSDDESKARIFEPSKIYKKEKKYKVKSEPDSSSLSSSSSSSSSSKELIIEIMKTNNYLPDDVINFACRIFRRHPFFIQNRLRGFIEAAILVATDQVPQSILGAGDKKFIQILYIDCHWITLSNWFSNDPRNIIIYDSRYHEPNYHTRRFLFSFSKLLYSPLLADDFHIQNVPVYMAPVQRQSDSISCGIFAIAFAVEILNNTRPEDAYFRESLMRKHLAICIRNRKFTRFPQKTGNCRRLNEFHKKFIVMDPQRLIP
jgi:hypothetical protein